MGSGEGEGCSANIEYLSVRLRISRNNAFCHRPTTKEILRRPLEIDRLPAHPAHRDSKKGDPSRARKIQKNSRKNRKRERENEVKSWVSREQGRALAACVAERGQQFGDGPGGLWV